MRIKLHRVKLLIVTLIALGLGNTPITLAANTQVLLSQVQVRKYSASDQLSRLHEAIVLKNDSEDDIDITNWCVYYASVAADFSDGTKRKIGCFIPVSNSERIFLKGNGVVRFGSFEQDFFDPSIFYLPSFSQGLGNEKGKIILSDGAIEQDRVEWGVHPNAFNLLSSAVFGRKLNEHGLMAYSKVSKDDFEAIEQIDTISETGIYKRVDACPGMEGFQLLESECAKEDLIEDGVIVGSNTPSLQIVEFFPNPSGIDTGKEFIELYNFGSEQILLSEYSLIIEGSSASSKKTYKLPDVEISPGEYFAIYNTGLQNFALNNTSGKITLMYNYQIADQASYNTTKEGYSWALIGDNFTLSLPSPNSENLLEDIVLVDKNGKVTEVKPCAVDQERNPATGRCRKIPSIATPTPCKTGQERNPETGRCRNISTKKSPTPCKAGQERNPTTGRCRNIKRTTPPKVGDGVKALNIAESGTFWIWLLAGLTLIGVTGYMGWEWRHEIKQFWIKLLERKKNPEDDL